MELTQVYNIWQNCEICTQHTAFLLLLDISCHRGWENAERQNTPPPAPWQISVRECARQRALLPKEMYGAMSHSVLWVGIQHMGHGEDKRMWIACHDWLGTHTVTLQMSSFSSTEIPPEHQKNMLIMFLHIQYNRTLLQSPIHITQCNGLMNWRIWTSPVLIQVTRMLSPHFQ